MKKYYTVEKTIYSGNTLCILVFDSKEERDGYAENRGKTCRVIDEIGTILQCDEM